MRLPQLTAFRPLLRLYAAALCCFLLAKPCFVIAQEASLREGITVGETLLAMWHGLPLDLATAGYLAAPVWLSTLCAILFRNPPRFALALCKAYAALLAAVCSIVTVADTCLYGFWGIKLDGTVWNYIDKPQGALASVSAAYTFGAIAAVTVVGIVLYALFLSALTGRLPWKKPTQGHASRAASRAKTHALKKFGSTAALCVLWLVTGGLIFLGIRGGVGKSTANVGMAYWSERQFLNHIAVNPLFSLVASSLKTRDFSEQGEFFDEARRKSIFATLGFNPQARPGENLLRTGRPNVLLILMEGCGAQFVNAVNPEADPQLTPNLNRLARTGVCFTQCYANSFRTDRGTLSALSGYPAFPDLSVMKLPAKCGALPSIASSLRTAGYSTEFIYGGDVNFTNTRGYLIATGYTRVLGDTHFPPSVRHTHDWGVTDRILFDTLYTHVTSQPAGKPWHIAALTLASHEPWEVPYSRIRNDERGNSMAYLDECIGQFIERFRRTAGWDSTLVVILPDHGIPYHDITADTDERKAHIPLILTGGALKGSRTITTLCNQSDLAATLLAQLRLPHADFPFSRDVLSPDYRYPSATHAWSEGIWWKDASGISVVNLMTKPASLFRESPSPSTRRVEAAKAYLQTAYDDLGAR